MAYNFGRIYSPDRITRNTVEALVAELAKQSKQAFILDSNMAQRVALYTATEQTPLVGDHISLLPDHQLTEYMSVREMFWFVKGLLNG